MERVHQIFKEVIEYIKAPVDIEDIDSHMLTMVRFFYSENNDEIKEWIGSLDKVTNSSTCHADTFLFKKHRLVIAYNYFVDTTDYFSISIRVMKDFPKPNLSIRRATFFYYPKANMIVQVDNEIPSL